MFSGKEKPRYERLLEHELERCIALLKTTQPDSPEFAKLLSSAERLHEMMDTSKPSQVNRDTLALIGANLFGILMIIKYEHVNVITSKALSFVIRPR